MSKYGRCNECGGTNGNHFSDCCYDGTSERGYDSWDSYDEEYEDDDYEWEEYHSDDEMDESDW